MTEYAPPPGGGQMGQPVFLNAPNAGVANGVRALVGLVIGTYAALPYIHLQLEALALEYGAEFFTHAVRHHHHLGDFSVYPVGLTWAMRRGLPYLLKISRRWIWQVDWRSDLLGLFAETGTSTVSNYTQSYAFGFRIECVAFDVKRWACDAFLEDVQEHIDGRIHVFVENYIHVWAQRFAETGSPKWREWSIDNPVPEERNGYAPWPLMGTCRQSKHPTRLRHDSESPQESAALAVSWGLPNNEENFRDPNEGEGSGKAP